MSEQDILEEQQLYYSARAQEYDESIQHTGRYENQSPLDEMVSTELNHVIQQIHQLGRYQNILELACGTGLWTKELLEIAHKITALDGSQEMLDLNRKNVNDHRITYEQVDLFKWKPERQYDLVFFAFWLSHVPFDNLSAFLGNATQAVEPNGRIVIVDEPAGGYELSGPTDGIYQTRKLYDGRTYKIIKIYYDPAEIGTLLKECGFENVEYFKGKYYFYLTATRKS